MMNRIFTLSLLLLLANDILQASGKDEKISLFYGFGAGSSVGKCNEGKGFNYQTGLLLPLKNDRFRLNPSVSFGSYSAKNIGDSRNQQFRNLTLATSLWVDVARETDFSLMIGGGTLLCHSKGLLGADYNDDGSLIENNTYFSNFYWGGHFGIGIRFYSPDRRINFELRPLNIHFSGAGYQEIFAGIGISVGL